MSLIPESAGDLWENTKLKATGLCCLGVPGPRGRAVLMSPSERRAFPPRAGYTWPCVEKLMGGPRGFLSQGWETSFLF